MNCDQRVSHLKVVLNEACNEQPVFAFLSLIYFRRGSSLCDHLFIIVKFACESEEQYIEVAH